MTTADAVLVGYLAALTLVIAGVAVTLAVVAWLSEGGRPLPSGGRSRPLSLSSATPLVAQRNEPNGPPLQKHPSGSSTQEG